ncbi:amino acid adenylation domain-containing protein [Rhodococcus sp. NPDC058521]|uniref:amino acid adenylation domain-containing protein n=1 Tax=Rhodococcus sp. NPDC058521 TaxID=3346536 RepID=UPI0036510D61
MTTTTPYRLQAQSIGTALDGVDLYVLDSALHHVPTGIVGELYIGGHGVGRGYTAQPTTTATRFIADPHNPGTRMYRTGDLVRWEHTTTEPTLVFIGRSDDQVKIRGFRIELTDIDTALTACPGVTTTHTTVREDTPGTRTLTTYYVGTTDTHTLRTHATDTLPAYMIPSAIVHIDALPLTTTGKIDRTALPAPTTDTTGREPRTPTEHTLLDIIRTIVGIPDLTVEDSFFEVGGDSISSIQVVSRARRAGLTITARDIIETQTVERMAHRTTQHTQDTEPTVDAYGEAPLTPVQRWLARRTPDFGGFCQSVLVSVPRFELDDVRKAILGLLTLHPILGARFSASGLTVGADPTAALVTTASDPEEGLSLALEAIDPCVGACFGAVLVDHDRLLLVAHHLVVDSVSWNIVLDDLAHLAAGTEAIAATGSSFREWALRLAGRPPRHGNGEIRSNTTGSALQKLTAISADPALDTASAITETEVLLPHDVISDLTKRLPHEFDSTAEVILLALTVQAFGRALGAADGDALAIAMETHGREKDWAGSATAVGWFTAMFPMSVPFTSTDSAQVPWLEQIRAIKRARHDAGDGIARSQEVAADLANAIERWPAVGFNYLGAFDTRSDSSAGPWRRDPDWGPLRAHTARNLPVPSPVLINAHADTDSVTMSIGYLARRVPTAVIAAVAQQLPVLARECARITGRPLIPETATADVDQDQLESAEATLGPLCDILPSTPMQAGILFHTNELRETGAGDPYLVQVRYALHGRIEFAAFERAVGRLSEQLPELTGRFFQDADGRMLFATPVTGAIPLAVPGASSDPTPQDPIQISLRQTDAGSEAGQGYELVLKNHHSLLDGWSMPLVIGELFRLYDEETGGQPEPMRTRATMADFHRWFERLPADETLALWREYLRDAEPTLVAPSEVSGSTHCSEVEFSRDDSIRLRENARSLGVSLNTVFQVAWGLVLGRLTRATDVVFGTVDSCRDIDLPDIDLLVGQTSSAVPVRVAVNPYEALADVLRQHASTQQRMVGAGVVGLPSIQSASGHPQLFDTMMVFENFPDNDEVELAPGVRLTDVDVADGTHYPITVVVVPGERIRVIANVRGAAGVRAEDVVSRLTAVIESCLGDMSEPTGSIGAVALNPRIVAAGFAAESVAEVDLVDRIEAAMAAYPNEPAVLDRGRTYTYAELNDRTSTLARELQRRGFGPECGVLVPLDRGIDHVVALVAILRAGATYVPVDPNQPESRLASIVRTARPSVVLTSGANPIADVSGVSALDVLDLGDHAVTPAPDAEFRSMRLSKALAYVIFTSGTTGEPKGVGIEYGNLAKLWAVQSRSFAVTEHDRVLQFASATFDAGLWQAIMPLSCGATSVVIPDDLRLPTTEFVDYLIEHSITVFGVTPSFLATLPSTPAIPSDVRIIAGAEALTGDIATRLREVNGHMRRPVFNAYGPTETTVNTATYAVTGRERGAVPIGTADPGTNLYVLDSALHHVPTGIVGELYIGGHGVGRGYTAQPTTTATRFIADPHNPGTRMYRTGDLVRWEHTTTEPTLVFIGRSDDQVKIRGFRIELTDIDTALTACPGVTTTHTTVREDTPGTRTLTTYYVGTTDTHTLRTHATDTLPAYMIPSAIVHIDALPLTTTGKIDRTALPAPTTDTTGREPRTPTEHTLLDIIRTIVGIPDLTVEDSFFEVGGDSISSIQVVSRARRAGLTITARDIIETQTVERMAHRTTQHTQDTEPMYAPGPIAPTPVPARFLNSLVESDHQGLVSEYVQWVDVAVPRIPESQWRRLLGRLVEVHPILGSVVSFVADDVLAPDGYVWSNPEVVEPSVLLTGYQDPDSALAAARSRIDPTTGAMFTAALVATDDPDHDRALFVGHHLVVDSVSWTNIFDLLRSEADAPGSGPQRASQYAALSARHPSEPSDRLDPVGHGVLPMDSRIDVVNSMIPARFSLSEEQTTALLDKATIATGTEIDVLFLTMIAYGVHEVLGSDAQSARIWVEGHGREDAAAGDVVGWLTTMYEVAGAITDATTWHGRVAAAKQAHLTRREVDTVATSGGKTSRADVVVNFLGRQTSAEVGEPVPFTAWPGSEPLYGAAAPELPLPAALTINSMALDGVFGVRFGGAGGHISQDVLDRIVARTAEAAEALTSLSEPVLVPAEVNGACLDQNELDSLIAASHPDTITGIAGVTPYQRLILDAYRSGRTDLDPAALHSQARFRVRGALDPQALGGAVDDLLASYPLLAARFTTVERTAVQICVDSAGTDPILEVVECAAESVPERANLEHARSFDLEKELPIRATLYRLAPDLHEFVFTSHHILTDGWSAPIVLQSLFGHYTDRIRPSGIARPVTVADGARAFDAYLDWVERQDRAEADAYYSALADDDAHYLALAGHSGGGAESIHVRAFTVPADAVAAIDSDAADHNVTRSVMLQQHWAESLIAAESSDTGEKGEARAVFAVMANGRTAPVDRIDTAVGLVANPVPVVAGREITPRRLQDQLTRNAEFAWFDLADAVDAMRAPLPGSLIVIENYPESDGIVGRELAPGLVVEDATFRGGADMPVTIVVAPREVDGGDELDVDIEIRPGAPAAATGAADLFAAALARRTASAPASESTTS